MSVNDLLQERAIPPAGEARHDEARESPELDGRDAVRRVAIIATFPPRQCGIATFAADLASALIADSAGGSVHVAAIHDAPLGESYSPLVRFEIDQNSLADYSRAAEYLNLHNVDVASIQHEFGIFGGSDGSHLIRLLSDLRMPIVTTLHTIQREPCAARTQVLREIERRSDRLVVLCETGRRILRDVHGVPEGKIELIPHGIPDVPFIDPNFYKDQFGIEGKKVLLSFGLLSPDKGIETMIQALPSIVERHPDVVYVVLGATHPNIRRTRGESYRTALEQLAQNLGVAENVIFENRFVDLGELCEYLGAADIYVTPYVKEAQISSGTLMYAMGAGKAIVSTPYWCAVEMLADGRGCLVPFRAPERLAEQINELLDDPMKRHALRKRAYVSTRENTWVNVARRYWRLFDQVREERRRKPRRSPRPRLTEMSSESPLPEINLDHLRHLTDDVGIAQHAVCDIPNRVHGYCTDDNARGLLLAVIAQSRLGDSSLLRQLTARYLAFVHHAFNPSNRKFRNFMDYDRRWLDEEGSEDTLGRSIWAIGACIAGSPHDGHRSVAGRLLFSALPALENLVHIRPMAFALLGLDSYLERFRGDSAVKRVRLFLAERMLDRFLRGASPGWPWPEDKLLYANASIAHALILSGHGLARADMMAAGLGALEWLAKVQTIDAHFVPIGNQGWFPRGQPRARFDQQPIEASTMVGACIDALRITRDRRWIQEAMKSFFWFLGQNDLGIPLYDSESGGCRDGLNPAGTNENQGAESTLAWLDALIRMHDAQAQLLECAEDAFDAAARRTS